MGIERVSTGIASVETHSLNVHGPQFSQLSKRSVSEMACGDVSKHYVDDTRLGRELAKLEATNPEVDKAAREYREGMDRLHQSVRVGGYEPEIHECEEHEWRAEDRRPEGGGSEDLARDGWYEMYICRKCRAARCDRWEDQPQERCLEHRHHRGPHRFPSGRTVKVGG